MEDILYKEDKFYEEDKFYNPEDIPVCNTQVGCVGIKDFLENENVKDKNPSKYEIPCSSENTCEAVQELLNTKDESYALYLSIKEDVYKNIQYHEDIINDLLIEIKRNLVMIDESKHRLKICYARYIKIV